VNAPVPEGEVEFGGFARLIGYDIGGIRLLAEATTDYAPRLAGSGHSPLLTIWVYIHLRDKNDNVIQTWDGPVSWTNDGNMYSTLVWEPGEYIVDERSLVFNQPDAPLGAGYSIVIGMYDLATGQRVPVTINGKPAGQGYTLTNKISLVPVPSK